MHQEPQSGSALLKQVVILNSHCLYTYEYSIPDCHLLCGSIASSDLKNSNWNSFTTLILPVFRLSIEVRLKLRVQQFTTQKKRKIFWNNHSIVCFLGFTVTTLLNYFSFLVISIYRNIFTIVIYTVSIYYFNPLIQGVWKSLNLLRTKITIFDPFRFNINWAVAVYVWRLCLAASSSTN